MRRLTCLVCLAALWAGGCVSQFGPRAAEGVVFYCPGAGNVDAGDEGLREGLRMAGFKGEVARLIWTISLNPAIDQAVRLNARLGANTLSKHIRDYFERYPDGRASIVGLSAGTGVALWALENLDPKYKVENVVLLSSSLSNDYDVGPALRRIKGKIYNYYSSNDFVLAVPMKAFGTIDARFGVDGAGAVGLHPKNAAERQRIVNIAWRPEFSRYGYNGGHLDSTSPGFIRKFVALNLLPVPTAVLPQAPRAILAAEP